MDAAARAKTVTRVTHDPGAPARPFTRRDCSTAAVINRRDHGVKMKIERARGGGGGVITGLEQ